MVSARSGSAHAAIRMGGDIVVMPDKVRVAGLQASSQTRLQT